MNYPWFKLHTNGWLNGTIRSTMDSAERGVFADLLAMASQSRVRGVVCRAKGKPYDREYLAAVLLVPLDLLNRTIEKCTEDQNEDNELHRIEIDEHGCLHVMNWYKYQPNTDEERKRKAEYKRQSRARAKDTQTSIDVLRQAINQMNIKLQLLGKRIRYVERDGKILDTETGEIVPFGKGADNG